MKSNMLNRVEQNKNHLYFYLKASRVPRDLQNSGQRKSAGEILVSKPKDVLLI